MLSAGQISCHIAEGETAEDWRGWFHLNNFMLWLAELNAHRHKTSTSEEDRSGKKKKNKDPGGGSYVKHNHLALWRGKKKKNIKWELIHISTEEISDSLGSFFFFSSRQKDNLYLCVSLLLLWLLCFLNFWLDWLKWLRSASTKKKNNKTKNKKNTTKRKGDKLIHDAQTWRHPTTTTNHGSQTREEER